MDILIVEDNRVRSEFFRNALQGHTLTFVTTAMDAIAQLRDKDFDFVFLDLDLEDGLERGLMVVEHIGIHRQIEAQVVIHSMNISTAVTAVKILPDAIRVPFAQLHKMFQLNAGVDFIERILEC
ncbi:MAG: response regulator [Desulfuromonadales bacterium]|nr:response regulator [Desulfuromonadales bacterium]